MGAQLPIGDDANCANEHSARRLTFEATISPLPAYAAGTARPYSYAYPVRRP